MHARSDSKIACGPVFTMETLYQGRPTKVRCLEIGGQVFTLGDGGLRIAQLEDEWYEDLADPAAVIEALRERADIGADLLSFWQRLPDSDPKYSFHQEPQDI